MTRSRAFTLSGALLWTLSDAGVASASDCVLTCKRCTNFPQFQNAQFPDKNFVQLPGGQNASSCMRRAEDFHHWCGNGRARDSPPTVSATYMPTGDTQVYSSDACEKEWSLYHGNCYRHVWGHKTWGEAEQWCKAHGGNLASIHGNAENEFIFTLTKGLTTWIGYFEKDKEEEEFQWSDDSKNDFDNMANDCEGREDDPDCKPEEKAKQWYTWDGQDRSTWVCKKPAKFDLKLMRNIKQIAKLWELDWLKMKVPLDEKGQPLPPSLAAQDKAAEPKEKMERAKVEVPTSDTKEAGTGGCVGDCPPAPGTE